MIAAGWRCWCERDGALSLRLGLFGRRFDKVGRGGLHLDDVIFKADGKSKCTLRIAGDVCWSDSSSAAWDAASSSRSDWDPDNIVRYFLIRACSNVVRTGCWIVDDGDVHFTHFSAIFRVHGHVAAVISVRQCAQENGNKKTV